MEIEGTVQGKRLSIKYVAIYLVEIIYHLKKFDVRFGLRYEVDGWGDKKVDY